MLYSQSLFSPITGKMATNNRVRPIQVTEISREPMEIDEIPRSNNKATGR